MHKKTETRVCIFLGQVFFLMCSKRTISYTRIKHGIESFLSHVQQMDYFVYTYQTWDRKFPLSGAAKGLYHIHISNMG